MGERAEKGGDAPGSGRRRWPSVAVAVLAALLVGAAVGWAGARVFAPPPDVSTAQDFTFAEVRSGEVGSSIALNVVAEWDPQPVGVNLSAGTVTSITVQPGAVVPSGSVLYAVGLRPVVALTGDVPAFRDQSVGVTGPDVVQLQTFLSDAGFLSVTADGRFGSATARAVKAWQKSLGIPADGVVRAADVIFLPTMPTRLQLDSEKIEVGAILSGGERLVLALPAQPTFTLPVIDSQIGLIPSGTRIEITGPSGQAWTGMAGELIADEDASAIAVVSADDQPICGDACEGLSLGEQTLLRSEVVTVGPVAGMVVPTAALHSTANGSVFVAMRDGSEVEVTVLAAAHGMSVVEGVRVGDDVRVPYEGG